MGSWHRWAFVVAFFLAALPCERSFAQFNPNGFIRTDAWNMLFLDQAYGGDCIAGIAYPGGGPVFMRANWVAPHDIRFEDPKAGDVWADLAFVAVPNPGPRSWTLTPLGASPTWVSLTSLAPLAAAALPAPVALPGPGDIVDFQTIVDRIRQFPDPDLAAGVTDNAVAISTTYVRNTTGSDLYVQIGSGSDDGIRVLVNDLEVHTKSIGRGVPTINVHNPATTNCDFEDFGGAVLPPGISKITAIVWEGGGGWALRLGIIRNGQILKDGNGLVEFLGSGEGVPATVGQDMPGDAFAFKNVNPFGWILTKAWNFLGPLDQRFGNAGGGPQSMLQNWTYPYEIGQEDPKSGDVWDIDFLRAGSQSYAARDFSVSVGFGDKPRWFTYQGLNDLVAPAAPALLPLPGSGEGRAPYSRGDINFEDLFRFMNARILRPNSLPPIDLKNCANPADMNADCDPDQYIMVATTYVRNKTASDLPVQVISGSDDACQVWVNCQLVTNVSFSRGTSVFGSELREAVLPPGISKIAFILVEGNGGNGFRLGLRPVGSLYNYADGDPSIEFLGHGSGDPGIVAVDQFCLERFTSDPEARCFDTATVSLVGNGAGNPGDSIQVVERISAFDLEAADISDISHGGFVTEVTREDVWKNVSSTGGDIWAACDSFQYDYALLSGNFDVSIEFIHRSFSGDETLSGAGKVGLMARETLANNAQYQMIQDFGPNSNDGARTARRRASLPLNGTSTAPCGNVREDATLGDANALRHPRFMRIKRIDQVITTWVSNLPGLGDGSLSATNDANWALNFSDNWAVAGNNATAPNPLPTDLYVGFANSEHNSFFADVQMAVYRILPGSNAGGVPVDTWQASTLVGTDGGGMSATTFGDVVVDKYITWDTTREDVNEGLTYSLTYDLLGRVVFPPPRSNVFAPNTPRVTGGAPINVRLDSYALNFFPDQTGPVGVFENSHDIGFINDPRTPGSTTYDEPTESYTVTGSGTDIWDGGDRMQFAYQRVSGDFTATARITNFVNPPAARWGRAGIMSRYTCDHNSKYSFACVPYRGENPGQSDAKRHQSRRDHLVNGTNREQQVLPSGLLTQGILGWVRLTRMGPVVASHFADDNGGVPGPWHLAGSDYDAQRPETLLVGLAAGSHSSSNPYGLNPLVVTYDNWSVTPLTAPTTGCTTPGGAVTYDFAAPLDPLITTVAVGGGAWTPVAVDGRLRLTNDTGNIAAAVWFSTDGQDLGDTGFTAEFDAYISKATGADPADGFTFAAVEGPFASATGFVGDGGGGLAYNRGDHNAVPTNSRRKSFAVEIDTWDGGVGDNDPLQKGVNVGLDSTYHMAIDVNCDVQSSQNNVEFGAPHLPSLYFQPGGIFNADQGIHVRVTYNPADNVTNTSLIEVFVRANPSLVERKVLSTRSTILSGDVFLGFTGATGGASGQFEIDNFVVRPNCCEQPDMAVIAQQDPVNILVQDVATLDGSGSTGADQSATYEWSVISGPAELIGLAGTPMRQVSLSGTGTVRVGLRLVDGCDDSSTAEMEFEVICDEPAEVAEIGIVTAPPYDEGSIVTLDSAGSSTGNRTWSIVSGPGEIVGSSTGDSVQVRGTDTGTVTVSLVVDDGVCDNSASAEAVLIFGSGVNWKRCDSNADGVIDLSDAVHTLNYLFLGGEEPACLPAVDCNIDEVLDISDPMYSLNVQFVGFPPPETWDTCENFAECESSCE